MLTLKRRAVSETRIDLVLNPVERAFFALIALALFVSGLVQAAFSVVSAGLTLISAIAALYVESWSFDADAREVFYRIGVFPFSRTRRYRFDELRAFELHRTAVFPGAKPRGAGDSRTSLPGFMHRGTASLSLRTLDDRRIVIQTLQIRREKEIEETAAVLSGFCGLPMTEL